MEPHLLTPRRFKSLFLTGFKVASSARIIWPSHSPDLTPLDSHYWGAIQKEVYSQKPETMNDLIYCVEGFAESDEEDKIRRVSQNMLKRARLCLRIEDGHYHHLL